nr:MAG TPA: holin [Caudoviricetes sp.]
MTNVEWVNVIVSILSGLAVAIPLVCKLVEYVKKAIEEKNWGQLVTLIMGYMEEAEKKFATGAEKKEWVMGMVESTAATINYPIDMEVVSALIDQLCSMSKVVNGKESKSK